jgi:hypothetical protein
MMGLRHGLATKQPSFTVDGLWFGHGLRSDCHRGMNVATDLDQLRGLRGKEFRREYERIIPESQPASLRQAEKHTTNGVPCVSSI